MGKQMTQNNKDIIKVICPGCQYEFDVERDFLLKAERLFCCNCTKAYELRHFSQAGNQLKLPESGYYIHTDPDGGYFDE